VIGAATDVQAVADAAARAPWARHLARRHWLQNLLLATIIAAASWPFDRSVNVGILDGSWQAALYLAVQRGVQFGPDFAFTYGPLGFLTIPWPWLGSMTLLALLVGGTIHLGVCCVAVVGGRRILPVWLAAAVAYLAARGFTGFQPSEALLALTFAGCANVLLADRAGLSDRRITWILVGAGLVAGAATLGKLTAGAFIVAMVTVTAVALTRPWWRGPAIVLTSAAIAALVLWLATGQRLVDLPSYIANAYEIVRGYSEAMGVDRTPTNHWYVLAYAAGVAAVARFAMLAAADATRLRQIALASVGALGAFAFFKIGVVRWGVAYALGAVLVALFAVSRPQVGRSTFLLAFAMILLPLLAALGLSPLRSLSPLSSIRSLATETLVAIEPWGWQTTAEATQTRFREEFAVEPALVDALRGNTVHVDPWGAGVIAAWPELDWHPVPVFQSYSAYTTGLDDLNAAALGGDQAPARILRAARKTSSPAVDGPPTIDGRNGWFEAPAAMLETFCRYDEVAASTGWEVLALTARKCGAAEPLASVDSATGTTVTIPSNGTAGRFVIVRIHGIGSPVDSLVTALFKAPEWYITVDGARFRLVPGTAMDGLLLAVPASIARSPGFEFGPPRTTISVERGDGAPRAVTFEFLTVPVRQP
jgi:hypothetical protein